MPLIQSTFPDSEAQSSEAQTNVVLSVDRMTLVAELNSPDADIRRAAIHRAQRIGAVKLLADQLAHETLRSNYERILTSMARIGGTEAVRSLVALSRGEDAWHRNAALETLQSMGSEILPEIKGLLADPDPYIRIFAVNCLQTQHNEAAVALALTVMNTDPHINVCAAAVQVLAEIGNPEIVPAFEPLARRFRHDPYLDFCIRVALRQIG